MFLLDFATLIPPGFDPPLKHCPPNTIKFIPQSQLYLITKQVSKKEERNCMPISLVITEKNSIRYLEIEFKNTLRTSCTVIKLVSDQGWCRVGLTNANQ